KRLSLRQITLDEGSFWKTCMRSEFAFCRKMLFASTGRVSGHDFSRAEQTLVCVKQIKKRSFLAAAGLRAAAAERNRDANHTRERNREGQGQSSYFRRRIPAHRQERSRRVDRR